MWCNVQGTRKQRFVLPHAHMRCHLAMLCMHFHTGTLHPMPTDDHIDSLITPHLGCKHTNVTWSITHSTLWRVTVLAMGFPPSVGSTGVAACVACFLEHVGCPACWNLTVGQKHRSCQRRDSGGQATRQCRSYLAARERLHLGHQPAAWRSTGDAQTH